MLPHTHKEQAVNGSATGVAPEQPAEPPQMSVVLVIDLMVCGLLITGLSLVALHLQPDLPIVTFFTGMVGGVLCVLWGSFGRRISCTHLGSMATLVPMSCVFITQAVQSWVAAADGGPNGRKVALLMTVQVVFCVGMLANLARERKGPRQ
jgi:peptidoglycan/LPS O-acetylase OafA/YrhL